MRSILSYMTLIPRKEVSTEEAIEINQDHNIHHHHTDKKVSSVVQLGVVVDDVPGEVELGAQTEGDVGEKVGHFVNVVHVGGLSACQLQHQP